MLNKAEQAQTISQNIKALREQMGWNQSKLANEAKISAAALSKIEQGENRVPTIVVLRKIAGALKVEIHDITGEQPMTRNETEERSFYRKFGVLSELSEEDQKRLIDMAERLKEIKAR